MADGPGDDEWSGIGRSDRFAPGSGIALMAICGVVMWGLIGVVVACI